eukprot:m.227457 g.227457  ORF g.227457 m.227457 type:complete len:424 (+) comp19243_c0_seq1:833-2104(+)
MYLEMIFHRYRVLILAVVILASILANTTLASTHTNCESGTSAVTDRQGSSTCEGYARLGYCEEVHTFSYWMMIWCARTCFTITCSTPGLTIGSSSTRTTRIPIASERSTQTKLSNMTVPLGLATFDTRSPQVSSPTATVSTTTKHSIGYSTPVQPTVHSTTTFTTPSVTSLSTVAPNALLTMMSHTSRSTPTRSVVSSHANSRSGSTPHVSTTSTATERSTQEHIFSLTESTYRGSHQTNDVSTHMPRINVNFATTSSPAIPRVILEGSSEDTPTDKYLKIVVIALSAALVISWVFLIAILLRLQKKGVNKTVVPDISMDTLPAIPHRQDLSRNVGDPVSHPHYSWVDTPDSAPSLTPTWFGADVNGREGSQRPVCILRAIVRELRPAAETHASQCTVSTDVKSVCHYISEARASWMYIAVSG